MAVGARPVAVSGRIEGVATDTRTMVPGCLFIALRGARFDGHAFLREAAARGAVAAITDRPCETGWPPCLAVPDTRLALGRLAAHWRRKMKAQVLAVTGSNGKTSVKEMASRILALEHPGIATQGNLNNDIGVPLTLLRLRPEHRYAVIEMGMNRPGEIAALAAIAAQTWPWSPTPGARISPASGPSRRWPARRARCIRPSVIRASRSSMPTMPMPRIGVALPADRY